MNRWAKVGIALFIVQAVVIGVVRSLRSRYAGVEVGKGGINAVAITSGVREAVSSKAFTGGYARAIMGGVELDLTEAKVASKPATIEVTIVMGGVMIQVPDDWVVDVQADVMAGGADVRHAHVPTEKRPEADLVITGKIVMGGLAISASDED